MIIKGKVSEMCWREWQLGVHPGVRWGMSGECRDSLKNWADFNKGVCPSCDEDAKEERTEQKEGKDRAKKGSHWFVFFHYEIWAQDCTSCSFVAVLIIRRIKVGLFHLDSDSIFQAIFSGRLGLQPESHVRAVEDVQGKDRTDLNVLNKW